MAVFMLDDVAGGAGSGGVPRDVRKHGSLIEADAMLLVRGKFEKDDETARLVATELLPMSALTERTTREVAIHLSVRRTDGHFEALAELLSRHRGDRRVYLELDVPGPQAPLRVRADVAQRVRPSERLVSEVEQLCGSGRWSCDDHVGTGAQGLRTRLLSFSEPALVSLGRMRS